jgi:hypothetical protein
LVTRHCLLYRGDERVVGEGMGKGIGLKQRQVRSPKPLSTGSVARALAASLPCRTDRQKGASGQ